MNRFVVFDVETPNRANDRMSAIGITVIEDGAVAEEFYSLVDPEERFDVFNVQLTGIDEEAVRDAPRFPELWKEIAPFMESGILVAHNAVFDLGVLKQCLNGYGIQWKRSAPYLCTVRIGRKLLPKMSHSLDVMCRHYGISLRHHHAASDSRACAEILLRYISGGVDLGAFVRTYTFTS